MKLYQCRCSYIINDEMKERLKGKGQFGTDDCFGCDSPFIQTKKLKCYFQYYFQKKKFRIK